MSYTGPWPFFPAPGNDDSADAFDSPNLATRFNDTHSTFDTSSKNLIAVRAKLEVKYNGFVHSFTAVIAIAAAAADGSTGGYGVLTGVEGGQPEVDNQPYYGTDGAFAIVWEIGGVLKIVEVSPRPRIRDVEARDSQLCAER